MKDAPRPLEKFIQRDILAHLKRIGIYAAAVPNGSVLAGDAKARAIQSNALKASGMRPGFADLIVIKHSADGASVGFLEVKREGEKLRPEQEAFRDQCGDWKLPFAVVRSVDDVKETLAEWGWA